MIRAHWYGWNFAVVCTAVNLGLAACLLDHGAVVAALLFGVLSLGCLVVIYRIHKRRDEARGAPIERPPST